MRASLFVLLWGGHVLAGTTYVYSTDTRSFRNASVHVGLVNGGGLRAVPDGVYPQPEPNGFLEPQHSVTMTDPGPFLYTTHTNPGVIYGYRRFLDGSLAPLPGLPYYLPLGPNNLETSPVWMVRHPLLPVLYTANIFNHGIGVFRIEQNGSLTPLPVLPLGQLYDGYAPQGLAISPDGLTLFIAEYNQNGILSVPVDPIQGTLGGPTYEAVLPGHGRGLTITDDGQFLYATIAGGNAIFGFRIQGSTLIPLNPASVYQPNDGFWPFIKGSLLVIGGWNTRMIAVYQIGSGGHLTPAPGSPHQTGIDFLTIYAAFDNHQHLFVGGNGIRSAFDVSPEGRLTSLPGSPLRVGSEAFFGVSVSLELIGDAYALAFVGFPHRGDPFIRIQGEPNTPFALQVGEACISGLITDAAGLIAVPSPPLNGGVVLQIKAYCPDETAIREAVIPGIQNVPTLSTWSLIAFTLLLAFASLAHGRRHTWASRK